MKSIILFLCVLVFSIFSNTSNLLAIDMGNNFKNNISNSSEEDIFGDEQTFPFVAGLGKNAAHWFQSSW